MHACKPWRDTGGSGDETPTITPLHLIGYGYLVFAGREHCGQFCSCRSLQFHEVSTSLGFLALNLKDFREGCRVEPLVPNQNSATY
jgi:hypothetical protein